jgi:hypothetical protein
MQLKENPLSVSYWGKKEEEKMIAESELAAVI